jgi:hypothetical protein
MRCWGGEKTELSKEETEAVVAGAIKGDGGGTERELGCKDAYNSSSSNGARRRRWRSSRQREGG